MTRFRVDGKPISQGSMSVFNGRIVHQKSKELMAWRSAIHVTCRERMTPIVGAVFVGLEFDMPAPQRNTRHYPFVKPDLDKLVRAVLDGLTGAAFKDDSQVVELMASKRYAPQGVTITVREHL